MEMLLQSVFSATEAVGWTYYFGQFSLQQWQLDGDVTSVSFLGSRGSWMEIPIREVRIRVGVVSICVRVIRFVGLCSGGLWWGEHGHVGMVGVVAQVTARCE